MADGSTFIPVPAFELVVFGATGDLARRKLIPSLYHRYRDGQIPDHSRIVGASRTEMDRDEFVQLSRDSLVEFHGEEACDAESWGRFAELLDYVAIDSLADDADWGALGDALGEADDLVRVFYLALPPDIYTPTAKGLRESGVARADSRIVLEKPIGHDFASAKAVNDGVGEYFDENHIYRIDHYLGKETVQNLLVLRFGNILLEPLWSNAAIDHIQITAAESIGVGGRGAYYEDAGALRDMVQNHLLQLLCLTCMETPLSLESDDVRTEKIKVLRALRAVDADTVAETTVRGQYARGRVGEESATDYLTDVDVDDSTTETFVAIRASVDNWRWAGVPIYLRTGKRMAERRSEIVIQFKCVPHSVFGEDTRINPNRLVIRLQPDEAVKLWMEIKEPGAGGMRLKTLPLNLTYADNFTVRYPDAYERLLMDVVRGNLSLFMRRDEVEAAWTWVDGILEAWEESGQRLELYPAGSDGPEESHDLLKAEGREWVST